METALLLIASAILLLWSYTTGERSRRIAKSSNSETKEIKVGEEPGNLP